MPDASRGALTVALEDGGREEADRWVCMQMFPSIDLGCEEYHGRESDSSDMHEMVCRRKQGTTTERLAYREPAVISTFFPRRSKGIVV